MIINNKKLNRQPIAKQDLGDKEGAGKKVETPGDAEQTGWAIQI